MKTHNPTFAVLVLVLGAWSCVSHQENGWNPLHGTVDLQFTDEDAVIDYEWGRAHFLGQILDLKIDGDENLYLADVKRDGVLKISPLGALLAEIGRRGQGPGEFRETSRLFISPRNELYVHDHRSRKIVKFDGRGDHISSITIEEVRPLPPSTDFFVDPREHVFVFSLEFVEGSAFHSLFEIDARGKKVGTIARFLEESMPEGPPHVMGRVTHSFTPRVFLASSGPRFYFGCSTDDRFFAPDEAGEKVQAVLIKDKAMPVSAKEKQYFERWFRDMPSQLKLPKIRPYYLNLLCDEKDRLYLVRTKSVLDKTPGATIDVLSAKGDFLQRIRSPLAPLAVRFNKFYAVESNDLDEYRILRAEIPGASAWKE